VPVDKKRKQAATQKQPNLVVVGSVALDILHTATASSGLVLGGSAVHFTNAASFFTSVGVVGVIGDDYPQGELAFLKKRGADFSGVDMRSGKSFLWEGRYARDFLSRETIRTELGVFADFKPVLPAHFRKPKVLFLAAIHPQLQWDVLQQVERPKLVAIDTFKLWIDTAKPEFLKVLKRCDLLFVNDDEVRWLTGEHNLLKGSQKLRKLGPQWIVVKKGEHGSFVVGEQGMFLSHTFPVPHVIDPTGAGDAYAGGLLGYLASCPRINETEIRRGMGWASVIGSFYVEGFGVDGLKQQTRSAVTKRYRDFVKLFTVP
jgi:sugar/nucleoside kinase (ribokinase family)